MSQNQNSLIEDKYTKYEIARILGARALQISMNAPLLLKIDKEELEKIKYDPLKIAELEFKAEVLPITVRRPFPEKIEPEEGEEEIEEKVVEMEKVGEKEQKEEEKEVKKSVKEEAEKESQPEEEKEEAEETEKPQEEGIGEDIEEEI